MGCFQRPCVEGSLEALVRRMNADPARAAPLAVMAVPTELSLLGAPTNLTPELQAVQAPLLRRARGLWMLHHVCCAKLLR